MIQQHTTYTLSIVDGPDIELDVEPAYGEDPEILRLGNLIGIAYLARDDWAENPLDDMDCRGHIYSLHRDAPREHRRIIREALGLDSYDHPNLDLVNERARATVERHLESFGLTGDDYYKGTGKYHATIKRVATRLWNRGRANGTIGELYAIPLDVYDHDHQHWSVADTWVYLDEQWDVARRAGLWVPDPWARQDIESYPGSERQARATQMASEACELYNAWLLGDVYGIVSVIYDENGALVDGPSSVWGHYGMDDASRALREELADLQKVMERIHADHQHES